MMRKNVEDRRQNVEWKMDLLNCAIATLFDYFIVGNYKQMTTELPLNDNRMTN